MTRARYRAVAAYAAANARSFAYWTVTGRWCPVLVRRESHAHSRLSSSLRAAVLAPSEGDE